MNKVSRATTHSKQSEQEVAIDLVSKIQSGNPGAEAQMVSRYSRGLKAALFHRCKDIGLAEDVMQESWIVVINKVRNGEIRKPENLSAFIIQVGKNQLIMKFRKQSKMSSEVAIEDIELASQESTPEQALINTRLGKTITRLFDSLSVARDKEILQKFYVTGLSKSSLCEEYELTEAHFDRVLYRARQRFKKLWVQENSD